MAGKAKTLFEKVWEQHIVAEPQGEPTLLYIDLHLIHEVTSPQAFDGLRLAGRKVRRRTARLQPWIIMCRRLPIAWSLKTRSPQSRLRRCGRIARSSALSFTTWNRREQGIVHVIGPELGMTKPGMTIVCGDSHTSTHGALGALAFGIGTSEVEHVLATQCLPQSKPKTFRIAVEGELAEGVTAKDIVLGIIGRIGTDGATGYVIEYAGSAIRSLSMEGRMTVCNMSIEAGARAGMIAPDETTFAWLKGRPFAPQGADWEQAVAEWRKLASDPGAEYDRELAIPAVEIEPCVTWGTNPGMVVSITGQVPDPATARVRCRSPRLDARSRIHGPESGHADRRDCH